MEDIIYEGYDADENKLRFVTEEMRVLEIGEREGNGGGSSNETYSTFAPSWELGAKGPTGSNPSPGGGDVQGGLIHRTVETYDRVEVELFIYAKGGNPGVGTGSYEIYLPDELEPALDKYVGHANLWIAGGGKSEFDGSVKWTFRNTEKGPKFIFTFDGAEWSPTHPKNFADLKLRANINYWL